MPNSPPETSFSQAQTLRHALGIGNQKILIQLGNLVLLCFIVKLQQKTSQLYCKFNIN
jgi:hypothetical protein